jgi:dihydrofolate reductase
MKEKLMAKVVIHTTITLDGFMARPNDSLDWASKYANDEMTKGITAEIGAVVMGNGRYNPAEDGLPYGGEAKVPQFVVTHHPRDPLTVDGLPFTFINNIERAVSLAREAAGEKSVMLLGASIAQQCLNAGLVDEVVLHLVPVLIGKGIRLFDKLKDGDIELERIALDATEQTTSLRFRVIKS